MVIAQVCAGINVLEKTFIYWLLTDKVYGIVNSALTDENKQIVQMVTDLYKRSIAGEDIAFESWEKIRVVAYAALDNAYKDGDTKSGHVAKCVAHCAIYMVNSPEFGLPYSEAGQANSLCCAPQEAAFASSGNCEKIGIAHLGKMFALWYAEHNVVGVEINTLASALCDTLSDEEAVIFDERFASAIQLATERKVDLSQIRDKFFHWVLTEVINFAKSESSKPVIHQVIDLYTQYISTGDISVNAWNKTMEELQLIDGVFEDRNYDYAVITANAILGAFIYKNISRIPTYASKAIGDDAFYKTQADKLIELIEDRCIP